MEPNSEPPFTFKPLTKGLGFHTTYDPAVVTSIAQPKIKQPRPALQAPKIDTPPVVPSQTAVSPLPAGVMRRTGSFLIDSLIHGGLLLGSLYWVALKLGIPSEQILSKETKIFAIALAWIFNGCILAALEISFGVTLGKKLTKISIHGAPGQIFFRCLFFLLTFNLLGLGTLTSFFDKKKRQLHDLVSGVQPLCDT